MMGMGAPGGMPPGMPPMGPGAAPGGPPPMPDLGPLGLLQQMGGDGGSGQPDLSFIIGMLAGAGLPVISRALKPGRSAGERQAGAGPMSPQGLMQPITSLASTPVPGQPSLLDMLPMLAGRLQQGQGPQSSLGLPG